MLIEVDNTQMAIIKSWNSMKYDRRKSMMIGDCSKELLDNLQAANRNNDLYSEVVVQRMKRIWRSCGQGCGD